MNICVHVSTKTLGEVEEYIEDLKEYILDEIGKNYISKQDYKELIKWYHSDYLTVIIEIVKIHILHEINDNYCDGELRINEFV